MRKRAGKWPVLIMALVLCAHALAAGVPAAGALTPLYLSENQIEISVGDSERLEANQRVVWSSGDARVATVSPDGTVDAHGEGVTRIFALAQSGRRKAVRVEVKAAPKPSRIRIEPDEKQLSLNETRKLTATVWPAAANQKVRWSSSNSKVASVSPDGLVTPRREGKVRISARAKAKTSVRATIALTVVDPLKPTGVALSPTQSYLDVGEECALTAAVEPATADQSLTWSSSRPDVVSVDENGRVRALSGGRAVITARTARGGLKAEAHVAVLSDERVGDIPARTTPQNAAAVKANVAVIDAVYESALGELERLSAAGRIGQGDFDKRKRILINAFSMYRFPWYTTSNVPYWSRAYAGKKDYRKGTVYYGLPYIQTGTDARYTNRRYNVAKAVSGGYFVKASAGCYRMTAKRQAGRYVGNDCSSFVCMSTFAGNGYTIGSSVCYMVTSEMAKSSAFNTVRSYDNLRPGDALVLGGEHAVMFLYYLGAEQKQMMILEQGGGNLTTDIHNTVTCSVVNRSSYSGKYTARRAKFLSNS